MPFSFGNCRPSCAELKISESLICVILFRGVASVLPLDAHRRLNISVEIWMYSWESLFYLTILKLVVINARYENLLCFGVFIFIIFYCFFFLYLWLFVTRTFYCVSTSIVNNWIILIIKANEIHCFSTLFW